MQEQTPPTPPTPPAAPPPDPVQLPGPGPGAEQQVIVGGIPVVTGPASPADIYQALRAQRRELRQQLEELEERRSEISSQLEQPLVEGADRRGLEQRISELDARISNLDALIATADGEVARAAALPGATVEPPPPPRTGPPEEVFVLGGIFIVVVLFPISVAYARRIWRRSAGIVAGLPKELFERLSRLEQGVDAVAVEVERIGESQRFMSRFFSENGDARALGAGAAQPLEVKQRERQEIPRR